MRTLIALCLLATTALSMAGDCCGTKPMTADEKFLHEAHLMALKAEGKSACCKSTPAKPIAKTEKGCCKAPGAKDKSCAKATKAVKTTKALKVAKKA